MNNRRTDIVQNRQSEDSPIFVVGAPRSGTSLLGRIVGLSPDVAVFEETGLFSLVYARRNPFKAHALQKQTGVYMTNSFGFAAANLSDHLRGINRLKNLLRRMLEYTRIEDYDLNPSNGLSDIQNIRLDAEDERLLSSLYEKYRSIMASDFGAIAGILLRDFRLLAEKERIAEKTPTHFLYLPPIFRFFPDARVVFISRDAREVLASYVCTFSYRHISWRRAVRHIHGLCEQARNVAKFYADDVRVLNVVYDELLTETTTTMRRIYGFLGVAPSADLDTKLAGVQRTASHSDKLTEAHKRYIDELLT